VHKNKVLYATIVAILFSGIILIPLVLSRSTHGTDMDTTYTSTTMSGPKARPASPSSTGINNLNVAYTFSLANSFSGTSRCNLRSRWRSDAHI
jgi:hypothetical protein